MADVRDLEACVEAIRAVLEDAVLPNEEPSMCGFDVLSAAASNGRWSGTVEDGLRQLADYFHQQAWRAA